MYLPREIDMADGQEEDMVAFAALADVHEFSLHKCHLAARLIRLK